MSKEASGQKYIIIKKSHFSGDVLTRSVNSYFRSLEAYLVKNNRKYNIEEENCFIFVNDREDAMSLGLHFNFCEIMYFDGARLLPIILVAKNKKQYNGSYRVIINNITGEKITTLRKLKEQPFEELKKHCLEKKEVIKRGVLTKKELENAINKNKLKEVIFLKRIYFDREELANYIKNKNK